MNKILILAFLVTLLVLMAAGHQEEEEEESSIARGTRETAPRRRRKNNGQFRKRKTGRRTKSKKSKGKKGTKKNNKNKKQSGKRNKPTNKQKRRKHQRRGPRQTCTANATCLNNAMAYLKMMKDNVGNYLRQNKRFRAVNKTGGKKSGKKGLFGPVLDKILEAGGGNKSALSCAGSTTSAGAKLLKNISDILIKCESNINKSCNPANFPLPNVTKVDLCVTTMGTFKSMCEICMKKNGTDACGCWSNSSFTSLATEIKTCKLSTESKAMVAQLNSCKGNFSYCKSTEDNSLKAISACSKSTGDLLKKAASLTANSAGLTAAKTTAASLSGSRVATGRMARATATTCAEVITIIKKLLKISDQCQACPGTATLAKDVTGVTGLSCTTAEKATLKTQGDSLDTAIAVVAVSLAAVQTTLETATGTTASTDAISSATAKSAGRRNIVARHLLNRFNQNKN